MSKRMRRFVRNTAGAALVEYALIVAGVALVGAAALSVFGNKVTDLVAMAAAIIPGAHSDTNAPIVSGKIIETSPNASGFDEGRSGSETTSAATDRCRRWFWKRRTDNSARALSGSGIEDPGSDRPALQRTSAVGSRIPNPESRPS